MRRHAYILRNLLKVLQIGPYSLWKLSRNYINRAQIARKLTNTKVPHFSVPESTIPSSEYKFFNELAGYRKTSRYLLDNYYIRPLAD